MKAGIDVKEKNKHSFLKIFSSKKSAQKEDSQILKELKELKQSLDMVYMKFEYATDTALIDCYIYELKALQMKYEYLMQRAKAKGLQADGFEQLSS